MTARNLPALNSMYQTRKIASKGVRRQQWVNVKNALGANYRISTTAKFLTTPLARLRSRIVNVHWAICCMRNNLAGCLALYSDARIKHRHRQILRKITNERWKISGVLCAVINQPGEYQQFTARRIAKPLKGPYDWLCLNIETCLNDFKLKGGKEQIEADLAGLFRQYIRKPQGS